MAKCDPKASRQSRDLDQVFSSPPSSQTGREALLQTRHLTIIASDRSFGNGDRPVLLSTGPTIDRSVPLVYDKTDEVSALGSGGRA